MWSSISHKLRSCSVVQLWWIWGCILLILLDPKVLLVMFQLLCTPQIFRKCLYCESFFISDWYWLKWRSRRSINHNISLAQCYLWFIAQPCANPAPLFCPWNLAGQLLQKSFCWIAKPENKFENAPCSSWCLEQCNFKVCLTLSWCWKWSNISLTWIENAEAAS